MPDPPVATTPAVSCNSPRIARRGWLWPVVHDRTAVRAVRRRWRLPDRAGFGADRLAADAAGGRHLAVGDRHHQRHRLAVPPHGRSPVADVALTARFRPGRSGRHGAGIAVGRRIAGPTLQKLFAGMIVAVAVFMCGHIVI
jgi:hypothetical protein